VRNLAPLPIAVIMMLKSPAVPARDHISVSRFDGALAPRGGASWPSGAAAISRLLLLPDGELLGLAGGADAAALELLRWRADGTPAGKARAEIGGGAVLAARVAADGTLVVVTARGLSRIAPASGRILAARAFERPEGDAKEAEASEAGAWLRHDDRLEYFGLDGQRASLRLPLFDIASARAPLDGTVTGRGVLPPRALLVTAGGSCFVPEEVVHSYEVKGGGPEPVTQVAITAVGTDGKARGHALFGEAESSREWFWKEYRSGRAMAPDFGLVRTHYRGKAVLAAMSERPDGDALLLLQTDQPLAVRMDPSSVVRWTRPLPFAFTWVRAASQRAAGTLIVGEAPTFLALVAEDGGAASPKKLPPEGKQDLLPADADQRIVLGRDHGGDWLLVKY
jgi:hypothetical protein